jgi:hypothetical protein
MYNEASVCLSVRHLIHHLTHNFFSRIRTERIIVGIGTMFGYNPNETDSKWTRAGKPAEYNPKQEL